MNIGGLIKLVSLLITLVKMLRPLLIGKQRPLLISPPEPYPTIDLEPEKASSMLEFQIEMENLFSKNQLIPRIREEFENQTNTKDFNIRAHMLKHGIQEDFGFDLLVQMSLHKRTTLPVLVGLLRKHFEDDPRSASQRTANAILEVAKANLVNWSSAAHQFIIRFDISPDVQADLDRYQYPLPMVVPPQELKTNHDTGYYTSRNSVILRHNYHDEDVCLDHLNHLNSIKFKLNQKVALTIKNRWRNLDKPKQDEEYNEYQKRVKAFAKYSKTAYDVLDHLGLSNEGDFWLTHKYDKRGRTYCQGYHVNYQGTPWNKAVIEFANQEITQ
jgi:hypothetical protein